MTRTTFLWCYKIWSNSLRSSSSYVSSQVFWRWQASVPTISRSCYPDTITPSRVPYSGDWGRGTPCSRCTLPMLRACCLGLTVWFVTKESEPMAENIALWGGYPTFSADLMEWLRITDVGWVTAPQCLEQRQFSYVLEKTWEVWFNVDVLGPCSLFGLGFCFGLFIPQINPS